jgi:hypothetical protein
MVKSLLWLVVLATVWITGCDKTIQEARLRPGAPGQPGVLAQAPEAPPLP